MASQKKVCVTGGSGFLGSWCVKLCLEAGYRVNCTTRSAEKAAYLKGLEGAEKNLVLFEGCNLLEEGSFDNAIAGCDAVLHTASPFWMTSDEAEQDKLVVPAVTGTTNVLSTCKKMGIKQVVLTSSTAAVYIQYGALPDEHIYVAEDWSPEDALRHKKAFYPLSKVCRPKS